MPEARATTQRLPRLLLLGFVCCALSCRDTSRENAVYPSRPIKLVVPFSAGGGTDVFARIFKKAIEDEQILPQPIVIVNLPGAGATIGSRRVKDAVPDGYTLLILHEAIITAKYANTVNYGPEAFEPIAATGEIGMVVAVDESSPLQSLTDLLEAAEDEPDSIKFAANLGAPSHFAGLLLEQKHPGAVFRFVQFGGGADRFAAIKGEHVTLSAFSLAEYIQFRPSGLRALAYFADERHPEIPEIPTAREQGIDMVNTNVLFWWVPKGTPQDRIDVLAQALQRAMQSDYVRQKLSELRYEPTFETGPPLQTILAGLTEEAEQVVPRKTVGLPNFGVFVIVIVVALSGLVIWQSAQQPTNPLQATRHAPVASGVALQVVASVVVYALVLSQGWLSFQWATMVFVLVVGVRLSAGRPRLWFGTAVLSLVLGLGLKFLFADIFQIDLP